MIKHVAIDRQLYSLSNIVQLVALAKRGHAVTMITGRIGDSRVTLPPLIPSFRLVTILLRRQLTPLSLLVFELKAFLRVLQLEPVDCVILGVDTLPAFLPFFFLRRLLIGRPVLFLRIESNPTETGGRLRSLLLSVSDAFSLAVGKILCDKILFISPLMERYYSSQYHIPKSKTDVWPSSVDMNRFDPRSGSAEKIIRLRKELGISDQTVVLYHGLLSERKGIMETVEAFKILKEQSVNAKLIILGYGPMREALLRYVQDNRLNDIVQIRGPVDSIGEVRDYVALCDVGILPMPDHPWWRYQLFIKSLELLAMNKPLIVSDIPANRSIIGKAPVAVYLKATTPQGIADGVREFMAVRSSLNATLGREIAARFSVHRIALNIEHWISFCMARKSVSKTSQRNNKRFSAWRSDMDSRGSSYRGLSDRCHRRRFGFEWTKSKELLTI